MNNSQYRYGSSAPYQEKYDNILRNYKIIDIGIILNISEEGDKVSVQGYEVSTSGISSYTNIELLYGSCENGDIVGNPCLLFRPVSDISSVRKGLLYKAESIHDEKAVKAIPLYFGNSNVKVGRKGNNYTINTSSYEVMFGEETISLMYNNLGTLDIDSRGFILSLPYISMSLGKELSIMYTNNQGIPSFLYTWKTDGTTRICHSAKETPLNSDYNDIYAFNKWSWVKTISPLGGLSVKQYDRNQKVLMSLEDKESGEITCNVGENTAVTMSQDGGISIDNSKSTVTITKDGKITITGSENITIDGDKDVTINGDSEVTISSKGTIKLGNSVSLKDILDDLNTVLSKMTVTGQATVNPEYYIQLASWATKYPTVFS